MLMIFIAHLQTTHSIYNAFMLMIYDMCGKEIDRSVIRCTVRHSNETSNIASLTYKYPTKDGFLYIKNLKIKKKTV